MVAKNKDKPAAPPVMEPVFYYPISPELEAKLRHWQGLHFEEVLKERFEALIKELTQPEQEKPVIIPREFMLKHLPLVVGVLPTRCTLDWDVHGTLDPNLNLHLESIKNHRRGR